MGFAQDVLCVRPLSVGCRGTHAGDAKIRRGQGSLSPHKPCTPVALCMDEGGVGLSLPHLKWGHCKAKGINEKRHTHTETALCFRFVFLLDLPPMPSRNGEACAALIQPYETEVKVRVSLRHACAKAVTSLFPIHLLPLRLSPYFIYPVGLASSPLAFIGLHAQADPRARLPTAITLSTESVQSKLARRQHAGSRQANESTDGSKHSSTVSAAFLFCEFSSSSKRWSDDTLLHQLGGDLSRAGPRLGHGVLEQLLGNPCHLVRQLFR